MSAESRFDERFRFARAEQRHRGVDENDSAFAVALGVVPGVITGYKKAGSSTPPVPRVLEIARRCGVDPGWLAFGEASAAPAPEAFKRWLANQPRSPVQPKSKGGTKPETGLPQFPMKPIAASQPATEKKRRRGGA